MRLRRSCLAVPGSSEKMLAKAATLPADQIFLDLEDAVSPLEKEAARTTVVDALNTHDYSGKTRVVRVNGVTTRWCLGDIVEVVSGGGGKLDCIMIPKVEDAGQLHFVDHLLTQLEMRAQARPPDRDRGPDRERAGDAQPARDRDGHGPHRDDHLRPRRLRGLDRGRASS